MSKQTFIKDIKGNVIGIQDDKFIRDANCKVVGTFIENVTRDKDNKIVSYGDQRLRLLDGK